MPPELPERATRIGGVVKVVGRVHRQYESRAINVDAIGKDISSLPAFAEPILVPSSFNNQLNHWKSVRDLHKTHYSCTEPFFISVPSVPGAPETPKKIPKPIEEDVTSPSVTSQTAAATSPIAASPVKHKHEPQVI